MEIFRAEEDYYYFMKLFKETRKEMPFEIYSYCLMPNHFHILIVTKDVAIGDIMKRIIQAYTLYFNTKYKHSGHLFQGRFKSCLITDDAYFMQVSKYIHLNPVKANIVKRPEHYKWSSYNAIVDGYLDDILSTNEVLIYFGKDEEEAIRWYKGFVGSITPTSLEFDDQIERDIGNFGKD